MENYTQNEKPHSQEKSMSNSYELSIKVINFTIQSKQSFRSCFVISLSWTIEKKLALVTQYTLYHFH